MQLSMTEQFTRYKNYSLEQLKTWVEDAIHSEASPEEIYTCIVEAVTDTLDKHRVYQKDSEELLNILGGTMGSEITYHHPKYSSFQEELEAEGYEYTPLSSNEQETLIEEGDKKKKHLKLVE